MCYLTSSIKTLLGDTCNPELNILQGKNLLHLSDKWHEIQNHSMDHRTLKTGCRLTFLGMQSPTHQLRFSTFLSSFICGRSQACCIALHLLHYFFKGVTEVVTWHPTQIIKIWWEGTEEEETAQSNQPAHLLANISCHKGRGKVRNVSQQQEKRKTHKHMIFHLLEQSSAFGHGGDTLQCITRPLLVI